jgi:hypothetical protein
MTLFPLKMPETKNPKSEEKASKWEPLNCLPLPYGPKGSAPEPSPSRRPGSPQTNSPREGKKVENEGPVEHQQPWPLPYQALPSLH